MSPTLVAVLPPAWLHAKAYEELILLATNPFSIAGSPVSQKTAKQFAGEYPACGGVLRQPVQCLQDSENLDGFGSDGLRDPVGRLRTRGRCQVIQNPCPSFAAE